MKALICQNLKKIRHIYISFFSSDLNSSGCETSWIWCGPSDAFLHQGGMSHCTFLDFLLWFLKLFTFIGKRSSLHYVSLWLPLAGDRQLTNQSNISCSIWHLHFAISEHLQYLNIVFHLQYMNNCSIWTLQYMNGHSDVIMGALLMDSESLHSKLATVQVFMCGIFLLTLSKISSIILFFYWFPMILIWSVVMIMMMMLMMMVIMLVIMMICWSEIPRCCPLPLRLLLGPSLFGHPWCQVWCLHPDHWSWSSSQLLAKHKLLHHICHIHPTPNIVYIITTIGLHCELWTKPLK